MLNQVLIILKLIPFVCFTLQCNESTLINPTFKEVIVKYINKYDEIENNCNAKPFYKIYFNNTNDTVGFWVGAHLGLPSLVAPNESENMTISNPIEIKGVYFLNERTIVIYDFRNSDGYGLYKPSALKPYTSEDFKDLPEECTNVWYPEAFFYAINKDSIYIMKKRDAFQLK